MKRWGYTYIYTYIQNFLARGGRGGEEFIGTKRDGTNNTRGAPFLHTFTKEGVEQTDTQKRRRSVYLPWVSQDVKREKMMMMSTVGTRW